MADEDDLLPEERRTAPAPARPGRGAAGARGDAESPPDSASLLAAGAIVDGKYRVEQVIGAGGMGVVVAATHLGLNERVALKFVKVGAGPEELVARLRREARLAFRIKSEHVARLLDVGALGSGAPYLVMEHLDGEDLARVLARRGPLPIEEAVDDVLQACEAMAEAHALGIVHRDLKPSNLFMTRGADGKPLLKVLDFGIAKAMGGPEGPVDPITSVNAVLGSPLYMSPEQVRGARTVDARCDVWALGVILHELVTAATPFAGGPASAVCASIAADPPERLRVRRADAPEALERVVLRCLEKDPAERCPSVGALAAALAPFANASSRALVERIASLASNEVEAKGAVLPRVAVSLPEAASPSVTASAWNTHAVAAPRPTRAIAAGLLALAVGGGWALSHRGAPSAPAGAVSVRSSAPFAESAEREETPPASPAVAAPSASPVEPSPSAPARAAASSPNVAAPVRPLPVIPRAVRNVVVPAAAPPAASATAVVAPAPPPVGPEDLETRATSRRH